jgi:hypothetical protein
VLTVLLCLRAGHKKAIMVQVTIVGIKTSIRNPIEMMAEVLAAV